MAMGRRRFRGRPFYCPVVAEPVTIALTRKMLGAGRLDWFVQCSEVDCQYSDRNQAPCPLGPDLFIADIEARRARRAAAAGLDPIR